jgi:hypothetical protein
MLQQNTIFIKVENSADDLSEEGYIGERSEKGYVASSPPCTIKVEPEVSHIFRYLMGVVVNAHLYVFMYMMNMDTFDGGYRSFIMSYPIQRLL